MAQLVQLEAKGLSLTPNALSAPSGSLGVASNLIMDRAGIYRSRRGMPYSASFASIGTADSMANYLGGLYAAGYSGSNINAPALEYATAIGNAFSACTASSPTSTATLSFAPVRQGLQMRFAEANKNLYASTWQGIQRFDSLSGAAFLAGMSQARDASAVICSQTDAVTPAGTYNTGFLMPDTACAYRVVWGYRDRNGNVVLGPPSGRYVVRNPTFAAQIRRNAPTSNQVDVATSGYDAGLPDFSGGSMLAGDSISITPVNTNNPTTDVKTVVSISGTTSYGSTINYTLDGATPTTYTTGYTLSLGMRPVKVAFAVPSTFTSAAYDGQFFVRVYRSKLSATANDEPSEEMYLCYEANSFASTSVTFTDLTPDVLLGEALYTSPTQEGPLQANYMPPACEDMALFAGSLFYANTRQTHRFFLQILSVDQFATGDKIYLGSESFTASLVVNVNLNVFRVYKYSAYSQQQNLRLTAQSLVNSINRSSATLRAYYVSGPNDAAGKIMVECVNPGYVRTTDTLTNGFSVTLSSAKTCFIPTIPVQAATSYTAASRSADGTTTYSTSALTGLKVGDWVQIVTSSNVAYHPLGLKRVTAVSDAVGAYSFSVLEPYIGASSGSATGTWTKATVYADDEARPNRLCFSKTGIPEAVPLLNYLDIGSANYAIQRIAVAGNSLFVFKEDGLFRVTGYDTASLQVEPFDPTVRLLAPNSVAKLSNAVYAWTNQGVVAVNESGVAIVSRPVDIALLSAVPSLVGANYYATGVGYESERLYLLCLSDKTYVYNLLAQAWTTWDFAAVRGGLVDFAGDKLILTALAAGKPRVELKSRTSSDFTDETGTLVKVESMTTPVQSSQGYYTANLALTDIVANRDLPAGTCFLVPSVGGGVGPFYCWALSYNGSSSYRVFFARSSYVSGMQTQVTSAKPSVTYYKPVVTSMNWTAQTAQEPALTKHWREMSLLTQDENFGLIATQFESDISRYASGTPEYRYIPSATLTSGSGAGINKGSSRTVLIPRTAQRASRLSVVVTHSSALREFASLGMALTVSAYDSESKVQRG